MGKIFKLYGKEIEFNDDLKHLYEIKCFFDNEYQNIMINKNNLFQNKENYPKLIGYIDDEINNLVQIIIGKLSKYDVYDKTVDDFLANNKGYNNIIEIISTYNDTLKTVMDAANNINEKELEKAKLRAQSQIRGLDFGIVSNSIAAHVLYASQEKAELQKQTRKAIEQYNKESEIITNNINEVTNKKLDEIYRDTFLSEIRVAIKQCIDLLFMSYVEELANCNVLDLSCLKQMNFERSNTLLKNVDIVKNKEKLICEVVQICPFNMSLYRVAYTNDIFSNDLINIAQYFELSEKITDKFKKYNLINKYRNTSKSVIDYCENNEKLLLLISKLNNQTLAECRKIYTKKAYDELIARIQNNKEILEDDKRFIDLAERINVQKNKKETLHKKLMKYLSERESEINYLIKECGYNNFYSEVSSICNLTIKNLDEYSNLLSDLLDSKVEMYNAWKIEEEEKKRKQEVERIQIEKERQEKKQKRIKGLIILTSVILIAFFGGNLIYKNVIYPSIRPYDQDVLDFFNNIYDYKYEFDYDEMKKINEKALEFKDKNIENETLKEATKLLVKGASIQNAEDGINNKWKKGISYKYDALSTLIANDIIDGYNEDIMKNIVESSVMYKLNALCKDKKNLKLEKDMDGKYYIRLDCYNDTGYDLSFIELEMIINGKSIFSGRVHFWCIDEKTSFCFYRNSSGFSLDNKEIKEIYDQDKLNCTIKYRLGPIVDVKQRYTGKNHKHVY